MAAGRGLGHQEVKAIEDSLETSKSCHQATSPLHGLMGKGGGHKGGGGHKKMKKEHENGEHEMHDKE